MPPIFPDKLLNLDLDFPGIDIGYELWAVRAYIDALEQHLPHVQDQTRLRSEAQLARRSHSLEREEISAHYDEIDEVVERIIPRFFRGPSIVTLWALYESSLSDLASYAQKREGAKLGLKDIRAHNFREQTEKYFSSVLGWELYPSPNLRQRIMTIQELRQLFAHDNGRLASLSKDKMAKLKHLIDNTSGVEIDGDFLNLSPDFLRDSLQAVDSVVTTMIQFMADRYGGSA